MIAKNEKIIQMKCNNNWNASKHTSIKDDKVG